MSTITQAAEVEGASAPEMEGASAPEVEGASAPEVESTDVPMVEGAGAPEVEGMGNLRAADRRERGPQEARGERAPGGAHGAL